MNDYSFDVLLWVTCNAGGAGTATATQAVNGLLYKITAIDGTLADAHTMALSVTETPSGVDETIWSTTAGDTNNDTVFYPRVQQSDHAADAIVGSYDYILVTGKPKLTVAAGGDGGIGGVILHFVS